MQSTAKKWQKGNAKKAEDCCLSSFGPRLLVDFVVHFGKVPTATEPLPHGVVQGVVEHVSELVPAECNKHSWQCSVVYYWL